MDKKDVKATAGKARSGTMPRRQSMRPPLTEKLGLTIAETAELSSLGQTSIYKAIRERRLRIRKFGTRTIVTRADLTCFLENLPDRAEKPET
jgi:excisionase family DNA binding protein